MSLPGLSPEEMEYIELVAMPSQHIAKALETKLDGSVADLYATLSDLEATSQQKFSAVAQVGIYAVGLQEFGDGSHWRRIAAEKITTFVEDNSDASDQPLTTSEANIRDKAVRELRRLVFSGMNQGEGELFGIKMAARIAEEDFEEVFELNPRYA